VATALFTLALAALVLGERPRARQVRGVLIGSAGLGAIALVLVGLAVIVRPAVRERAA
jgi:hypothetical protein